MALPNTNPNGGMHWDVPCPVCGGTDIVWLHTLRE